VSHSIRRPFRVLYVLTSLDVGGAEQSLLETVSLINRDRFEPIVCSLISGGTLRDSYLRRGIPVVEFGVKPGFAEAQGLRLIGLLRRSRPDVVHSRLILSNLWARLGRLSGAKVICEERGLADQRPRAMTLLNRLSQPLCTMNVANSHAVAHRMRHRDRIPPDRLRVIYGGVDCVRFLPAARAARSFDIVSVTRLEHYKGVFDLVDAFRLVRQARPDVTLSIVGDGSQRSSLERHVSALGLAGAVTIWGHEPDVLPRLHEARVFALSSHEEGLPNAVIEAMSCALPVVATHVGGTPELVVDRVTGHLVPPRNAPALAAALLHYLDDPAQAELHGAAGRDRAVRCFDLRVTANAYVSLYKELFG
jgi:glycosyltransferase involved in cell wall biosynthesis